jgi:hypothetical protein
MMKITVQTGNLSLLKEGLASDSQSIRFGSEFCMYALPTSESVEKAHRLTRDSGKEFTYVTPRLAEGAMDSINEHLVLLNDLGEATVIANDLGTIHALNGLPSLKLALGRQLVYTPSRCPWNQITEQSVNIFTKRPSISTEASEPLVLMWIGSPRCSPTLISSSGTVSRSRFTCIRSQSP